MKIRALTGLLCCILFGGCANGDELQEQPGETGGTGIEESISLLEEKEQPEQTIFGAVPYFDEDTDGMLQYADGGGEHLLFTGDAYAVATVSEHKEGHGSLLRNF